MAASTDVELTKERWAVVKFVRNYFEINQSVPEARFALKAMKEKLGEDKGTRRYLYQLFPCGYAQQACKFHPLVRKRHIPVPLLPVCASR